MKFSFPIRTAYDLQSLLNSVERVRRAVPNKGIKQFEQKWSKWSDDEKRLFLSDVMHIREPYWELRSAKVAVEATFKDASDE